MLLQDTSGVRVEAWHQSGAELAALFSWNGSWILFDRFNTSEGTDTVVVLSAPTWEMQLSADELIMATQSSVEDQWDQAGRDD